MSSDLSVPSTEGPLGADVLVCDDSAGNRKLLRRVLAREGYLVRCAASGAEAIEAVLHQPPDLVILDIIMPEMDGFEVCEKLRRLPEAAGIPIIFISGLMDSEDKIRALELGGVDYITKPFKPAEVHARVASHLRLRGLRVELEAKNESLEAMNRQLAELQRMQNALTNLIVHDLRNPLSGIVLSLEMLAGSLTDASTTIQEDLAMAVDSSKALSAMVEDLLDVTRLESAQMALDPDVHQLQGLVNDAMAALGDFHRDHAVDLDVDPAVKLMCDGPLVRRAITHLLTNAIEHTSPRDPVRLRGWQHQDSVRVEVTDHGGGIPKEQWEHLFDKFDQATQPSESLRRATGLGLTFCKLAAEAQGGSVGLRNNPSGGCTFWLTLPTKMGAPQD